MIKNLKDSKNSSFVLVLVLFLLTACSNKNDTAVTGIGIYPQNPRYWTYNGRPVLLLGGSDDDNLFQWPKERLIPHLDEMKAVGANYVRNTMSDRKNLGFEEYPFKQLSNGKYDLSKWNDTYWNRFKMFLDETSNRDIVVQIEIWDRFDYSRKEWGPNPYNPANNVNYTFEESGFEPEYPKHPGANKQPFFFTTPGQSNNETVLKYQQAFVEELLSVSLKYNHVLYCIDNETSGQEEWSAYWAKYIKQKAGAKKIYVTEMWDAHDLGHQQHKRTFDHPELYDFVDISQNSWNKGYDNWLQTQKVMEYLSETLRPVNSVKIYGSNENPDYVEKGITAVHAKRTFFRNVIGGFASSRFHRPISGQGLNDVAKNCIKSVRLAETKINFWECNPSMELLGNSLKDVAYACSDSKGNIMVYITGLELVQLDISAFPGDYQLSIIDIGKAKWGQETSLKGNKVLDLISPYDYGALLILTKKQDAK